MFPMLQKTTRYAAIILAVLFIGLSLFGIVGAWFVHRKITDVALNGFRVIETGVGVATAGVGRVDALIATSRTEVRQASEIITAAGARPQANSAALNALNERLEMSLAPRIAQMQQALAPVRDAVGTVDAAVSFLNSVQTMPDRAPRLAALDATLNRLEELAADATQLRDTLGSPCAMGGPTRTPSPPVRVNAPTIDMTAETVATLNQLTTRINTRLGEVQVNVQGVQADIAALQVRLDTRKSRLLSVFNLLALLPTLISGWIIYSQVVVIQHHRGPRATARG
jgi:hypothetical protein